jgi:hypothetical protein
MVTGRTVCERNAMMTSGETRDQRQPAMRRKARSAGDSLRLRNLIDTDILERPLTLAQ